MKRRLTKLVVFLILGAIVNVAVAWGFAASTGLSGVAIFSLPTAQEVEWWADHAPDGFLKEPETSGKTMFEGIGSSNTMIAALEQDSQGFYRSNQIYLRLVGWPVRCVEGAQWRSQVLPSLKDDRIVNDAALPLSSWVGSSLSPWRWLPLRPIWPGFAINTIFYAAMLWLLTLAPFTARRMIRRKRGLCIKCGYDLRGTEHEVCPECGKELSVR